MHIRERAHIRECVRVREGFLVYVTTCGNARESYTFVGNTYAG